METMAEEVDPCQWPVTIASANSNSTLDTLGPILLSTNAHRLSAVGIQTVTFVRVGLCVCAVVSIAW